MLCPALAPSRAVLALLGGIAASVSLALAPAALAGEGAKIGAPVGLGVRVHRGSSIVMFEQQR